MGEDRAARAVEVLTLSVAKLALQPGEVLLVKVPASMEDAGVWKRMNEHLARTFPNNKVLLATQDIEFSVIAAPA
jgi:hypothetical protein